MKPKIIKISQISPDQSVICILGNDEIPETIRLRKTEREYALKQLRAKEESVFINSYFKCTYLVKVKGGVSIFKAKEELRKAASNLKKLIKSNNHTELVITSYKAYKEAIEDFTEGFLLSIYSFDKYKTSEDEDRSKRYPSKLLLYGDIGKADLKWLDDITDAVFLGRDLINEPANRLNTAALASAVVKTGKDAGFSVEVLNKGKIEALKMGGLLAVNRGSVDPPTFSVLTYQPEGALNEHPTFNDCQAWSPLMTVEEQAAIGRWAAKPKHSQRSLH